MGRVWGVGVGHKPLTPEVLFCRRINDCMPVPGSIALGFSRTQQGFRWGGRSILRTGFFGAHWQC